LSKSYADRWSSPAPLFVFNLATGGLKRRGLARLLLFSQVMKYRCQTCHDLKRPARGLPSIAGHVPAALGLPFNWLSLGFPFFRAPLRSPFFAVLPFFRLASPSSLGPHRSGFLCGPPFFRDSIDWHLPQVSIYSWFGFPPQAVPIDWLLPQYHVWP